MNMVLPLSQTPAMTVHHVGFACADIPEGLAYVREVYQVTSVSASVFDSCQNATVCMVETANGISVELISGAAVAALLDRGISLYHIGYAVADIEQSIESFLQRGARKVTEIAPAILFDNRRVCFLQTPLGLIELVEAEAAVSRSEDSAAPARTEHEPVIAICSTFTADPIIDPLRYWSGELAWPFSVQLAPPGQLIQHLVDPTSPVNLNRHGVNVVLLKADDLLQYSSGTQGNDDHPEWQKAVDELARALQTAASRTAVPHLVLACPSRPDSSQASSIESYAATVLSGLSGVYFVPSDQVLSWYPVTDVFDEHAYKLAEIPYSSDFFVALATTLVRKTHALFSAPRKVIVLDCDNTLWRGICGEDGPAGVQPILALQRFMRAQYEAGRILCLCSKNDERDVWDVFATHKGMPLSREHLIAWRINWNTKSQNLKELASQLGLALNSFIFLDDNPVEAAEVQAVCPEVLTLVLPEDADTIPAFLNHVWAFDQLRITREDSLRSASYQQERLREQARQESGDFQEFLAGLNLQIAFAELDGSTLPRAAQLTQRTTQFNTTTRKRTESEIRQLLESGRLRGVVAHVQDRFGDYGLVGVMLYSLAPGILRVDSFLLSCRALGKQVEHQMLARLGEIARAYGADSIEVEFVPTSRNLPALQFFESLAEAVRGAEADFCFPAQAACAAAPANLAACR